MMQALQPAPADLANLLVRVARAPWPASEEERLHFFADFGFQDLGVPEVSKDDEHAVRQRFDTASDGKTDGSAFIIRGQLQALQLTSYSKQDSDAVRAGFDDALRVVSEAIGSPAEQWGPASEPACAWKSGLVVVEMYCLQRGSSALLAGVSRVEGETDAAS